MLILRTSALQMRMDKDSNMNTAVIYARVSSTNDRQNTQRQIEDLTRFANSNDFRIIGTYEEHISGATKNENRTVLMECLDFCVSQNANFLLLSELSRLGRSTLQVLKSLKCYLKREYLYIFKTSAYTHYSQMESLTPLQVLW